MEIDDRASSGGGSRKQHKRQRDRQYHSDWHDIVTFRGGSGTVPGQVAPRAAGKAEGVNESDPAGNSVSTRCRYCGCDESTKKPADPAERRHLQVIVACGSCGRQFTVLSVN